ncbi:Uncharacterised protein [Buttiauxella agrestis]|uniref:Phage-related minor tail protein n=1 Tax=Buttiauxella agrestis TaxID=82977 RepID=A0A381C6M8_9ENTR|nr:hypothetical protein [Buttiauxella agrestis]SUW63482.1 Uncharacterised protein [Buttiauxella agrestis]
MGVLDSFVFLLETDNKNALKGIHEAGTALDDVEDGSKDAKKAMLDMFTGVGEKAGITAASFKEVAIGALGIAGAGLSLNAVLEHTEDMLNRVRDAETVGVDIGQYDALSRTFQNLGVDADGFRDSMIDLNEALGEAAADAKSGKAESFKTFGISLKDTEGNIKSADQALLELSGSMEKMDKQQATFQIKQLGITDNAVISAMLKGQKELERQIELQKALGVLNEKDVEQLKRFKLAQNELSTIFSRFADVLSMAAVPALELIIDVTKDVIKWGREHKGFLIGFFGALATVAIPMLTTSLWSMATAAWAAMAPFIPFIAAAVALGLVVDDLWNYFNGGESVIGDLVQRFPALGAVLEDAKASILALWEALKVLFTDPSQFMDNLVAELKQNWDTLVSDGESAANALLDAITKVWDKLSTDTKAIFSELLAWIKGLFSQFGSYISNSVSDAANAAYDSLPDFVKKGINLVKGSDKEEPTSKPAGQASVGSEDVENSPGGKNMMVPGDNPLVSGSASASAANHVLNNAAATPSIPNNPAAISNSRQTSVQNTQKIENVNITTGSGDPQQIRTAVSDGMSDSVQQMTNQYDNGVSH